MEYKTSIIFNLQKSFSVIIFFHPYILVDIIFNLAWELYCIFGPFIHHIPRNFRFI